MMDKHIKISFVIGIMAFITIVALIFLCHNEKERIKIKGIDSDEISDEMKKMVYSKQLEASKQIPKDKRSFPLLIGSEGDNVERLQKVLGITPTGKLDAYTLDKYKMSMSDIPNMRNTDKISEASIILLENYTRDIEVPTIGDKVFAKNRMGLSEYIGWDGLTKKPIEPKDKKMNFFDKDEVVGVVKDIINNTAVVESGSGKYYIPKISSIKIV